MGYTHFDDEYKKGGWGQNIVRLNDRQQLASWQLPGRFEERMSKWNGCRAIRMLESR